MLSPPQRNGRANLVGRTARGFLALPRQSPLATAAQIRQGNLPPPRLPPCFPCLSLLGHVQVAAQANAEKLITSLG